MKSLGLSSLTANSSAGLERRLVGAELGAPGAPAGLDAQRIERVVAGVGAGPRSAARLVQRQVDVARHLDRHVELEARPADVAHARRAHAREAEVDLARRARTCSALAATGRRGPTRPSSARAFGPISESTAGQRADVGRAPRARRRAMWRAIQSASRVGCAEPVTSRKRSAPSADDREVALEAAALVEHRGVDHAAGRRRRSRWRTGAAARASASRPCSSSLPNEVWS